MKSPLHLLYNLIDYIVPPRRTETIVASLSIEDLYSLQTENGLPYHDDKVAALVWELKYYANPRAAALAGELLAEEITHLASEEIGVPLLVPVPMHHTRRSERGHNQTEVLCEALLQHASLDYAPSLLRRSVATVQQQGLPKHKRVKNVHGAMEVSGKETLKDRVCIVVDDVQTTGATLSEAKRALLHGGARKVVTVALAHS